MTADDTTPHCGQESTGIDSEKALAVGREAIADSLDREMHDLNQSVTEVAAELKDGEGPTVDQVNQLRRQIDGLRFAVEEYMAELSSGAEPWETDGAHRSVEELMEMAKPVNELVRDDSDDC